MKTLVLGVGNTVLCDDGVGVRVASELSKMISDPTITVAEACDGGISLVEAFLGYDHVVLIDAIQTGNGTPGDVYELRPEDLASARHLSSPHQATFTAALDLFRTLGLVIPSFIDIVAVEVEDVTSFSDTCTPRVEKAIPVAVERALKKCRTQVNCLSEG